MKQKKLLLILALLFGVGPIHAYKKVCHKEKFGTKERTPFKSVKPSYYFIDEASRKKLKTVTKDMLKDVMVNRCYVRLMPKERSFVIAELKKIGLTKTLDQAIEIAQKNMKMSAKKTKPTAKKSNNTQQKTDTEQKKAAPVQKKYYKTLIKVLQDFKNTRIQRVTGVLMRLHLMYARFQNMKNKKWFNSAVAKKVAGLNAQEPQATK